MRLVNHVLKLTLKTAGIEVGRLYDCKICPPFAPNLQCPAWGNDGENQAGECSWKIAKDRHDKVGKKLS